MKIKIVKKAESKKAAGASCPWVIEAPETTRK
jgi:hypothetical protein